MHIGIVTLFPEMLKAVTDYGVTGRAVTTGKLVVNAINPREFTQDRHQTVDDRPFGGGPGMVMKVAPVEAAIKQARQQLPGAKVIYLSPTGKRLTQQRVTDLAAADEMILLAGRYEGIDQRIIESSVDEIISIGDYVLSGGELPALVLTDAVARCLPGVLGDAASAEQDSFSGELACLLDYPHYTRPEYIDDRGVPDVLMSGNHDKIKRWRRQQALGRTWKWRPDLLARRRETLGLSDEDEALLADYISQQKAE